MAGILFLIAISGSFLTWILAIRPFVYKHHEGYKTGANLAVAAWVDWSSCGEIARKSGSRFGLAAYRTFAAFQILGLIAVGLALFGGGP